MEVLYEADIRRADARILLKRAEADPESPRVDGFTERLVNGVSEHLDALDGVLGRYARGWTVARMPVVDRNILRVGAYELLHVEETPPAVAIDEAVEIAKSLASDESPRYVNGVLSAVHRGEERGTG